MAMFKKLFNIVRKTVILLFAMMTSSCFGWESSIEKFSNAKAVESPATPTRISKTTSVWLDDSDHHTPILMNLRIENETLICVADPYIIYERVLQLEISYLNYLISTGDFSNYKSDLKLKNKKLVQLRDFCLDNEPNKAKPVQNSKQKQ